jgi:hypothetical protein
MTKALRHRCRNPHCGMKLSVPVENEHHAFCTRGCFNRFYFNRCRVCEKDLRKKGKRGDANRLYCRPPNGCAAEARQWPQKYEYGQTAVPHTNNVRSAHSTGLKFGLRGHPSPLYCLREWWWGGDGEHDHSLYDRDGLTIARIVLVDGRYHLRTPIVIPRQSWPGLDAAKRGAEAVALWALPNRKRDIEIVKRPVVDWYDRLDGSRDYYDEEGRHVVRLIRSGKVFHLAKPVMSGSWPDRDAAKAGGNLFEAVLLASKEGK